MEMFDYNDIQKDCPVTDILYYVDSEKDTFEKKILDDDKKELEKMLDNIEINNEIKKSEIFLEKEDEIFLKKNEKKRSSNEDTFLKQDQPIFMELLEPSLNSPQLDSFFESINTFEKITDTIPLTFNKSLDKDLNFSIQSNFETPVKVRYVGKGTYGKVYELSNEKNEIIIKKEMEKIETDKDCSNYGDYITRNLKEIAFLSSYNSIHKKEHIDFLPLFKEIDGIKKESLNFELKMTNCGEDLNAISKKKKYYERCQMIPTILFQMSRNLRWFQERNLGHLDLTLKNICWNEENQLLSFIDFNLIGPINKNSPCYYGTPSYTDFQLFDNHTPICFENDIFSCGIILFSFLMKNYIDYKEYEHFSKKWKKEEKNDKLYKKIFNFLEKEILISENLKNLEKNLLDKNTYQHPYFSKSICEIIFKMIDPNPLNRIQPSEIYDHPIFSSFREKYPFYSLNKDLFISNYCQTPLLLESRINCLEEKNIHQWIKSESYLKSKDGELKIKIYKKMMNHFQKFIFSEDTQKNYNMYPSYLFEYIHRLFVQFLFSIPSSFQYISHGKFPIISLLKSNIDFNWNDLEKNDKLQQLYCLVILYISDILFDNENFNLKIFEGFLKNIGISHTIFLEQVSFFLHSIYEWNIFPMFKLFDWDMPCLKTVVKQRKWINKYKNISFCFLQENKKEEEYKKIFFS